MEDANNAVVIHAILPFLTGKDIARLECVSKKWRQAVLERESALFRKALDRERSRKNGDFSSAGSELCVTISAKEVYKHQHAGKSMMRAAVIAQEIASKKARDVKVVAEIWKFVLGLGVFPYFILLSGGMDYLSAFISVSLILFLSLPCTKKQRGIVFSLILTPSLYVFCTPLRPFFHSLAIYALGFFPQVLGLFLLTRFQKHAALVGMCFVIFSFLEINIANWLLKPFPDPVDFLPSLFLCLFRIAPVAFACDRFERREYRSCVAGVVGFLSLECLFSFHYLPFYWFPYYLFAITVLLWTFAIYSWTRARHPLLPLFILMFPLCFQLWHRVRVPLCPMLAFFLRILPFLCLFLSYLIIFIPQLKFTRILPATLLVVVAIVGIEFCFAIRDVSVHRMSNVCSAELQGSVLSSFIVS